MGKKLILLIVLLFIILHTSPAQKLVNYHLGFSFLTSWKDGYRPFYIPAITAGASLNLIRQNDIRVSLSAPISFGPSFKLIDNGYGGVDLPLLAVFNFGKNLNDSSQSHPKFFVGAGFGYHFAGRYRLNDYRNWEGELDRDYSYPEENFSLYGWRFITGFNISKPGETPVLINMTFGKASNGDKKYLVGVGGQFLF